MQNIFPKKLKPNDTIGLLSVAGSIEDKSTINKAISYFQSKGFRTKVSENINKKERYLSGTDIDRANSINEFFADKSIDAIIAIRGGYGSIRLLDKIDYENIKNNPKIFAGYSDITALSLMIYKKTNLITFNAPMICSDFGNNIDNYSENSFYETLQLGKENLILQNPVVYKEGQANGILWGGNLSTIQSLCGLDFLPDEEFIFVIEDINEPVYKIDKMLTQLFNISNFKKNITAMVLGDFSNINNKKQFDELIQETADTYSIPIISGLKFGHEKEKTTFPIGVKSHLNTKTRTINICEKFLK